MRILALNSGSSSIKAALIDVAGGKRLLDVRALDIGTPAAVLKAGDIAIALAAETERREALRRLFEVVAEGGRPALDAIAHRVVHGGADFAGPVLLDESTLKQLAASSLLAPLHNPPALEVIAAAREAFPALPHIAVFDTTFHSTLPRRAREYALPRDVVTAHGIRRFGFHGISHEHVTRAVARFLKTEPQALRIVSCHLGNGASCTAVEYGRSVETSMGMTPLEGLVMGTRGGDLDPGILLALQEAGFDASRMARLLNVQSGLKGLTGTENMAEIEQRAAEGDEACRLAITLFAHRVRKYIGAYAAVMGGLDAIVFTGGIGEHSALIRHRVAQRFDYLGAVLDEDRNRDVHLSLATAVQEISASHSRVRLLVVRADEESALAQAAARLLEGQPSSRDLKIPIAVSARHVHLSQRTIDQLFGLHYRFTVRKPLSQPGQFAAEETVTLIGPRGSIESVRVLGPPRSHDQVEISRTDEFTLGIDAPVRVSGDIDNSPGIVLAGPKGRAALASGVICARRHIHMHPDDARRFGVKDHDVVAVRIDSQGRDLTFGDVTVRVSPEFRLEMHVDADEANAAGLSQGDSGELFTALPASARIE